jgi:hypothetical protein
VDDGSYTVSDVSESESEPSSNAESSHTNLHLDDSKNSVESESEPSETTIPLDDESKNHIDLSDSVSSVSQDDDESSVSDVQKTPSAKNPSEEDESSSHGGITPDEMAQIKAICAVPQAADEEEPEGTVLTDYEVQRRKSLHRSRNAPGRKISGSLQGAGSLADRMRAFGK